MTLNTIGFSLVAIALAFMLVCICLWARRYRVTHNPFRPITRRDGKIKLLRGWGFLSMVAFTVLSWTGCAHFASRTYEEGVDPAGKPINRTTHMYITTFFDSNTTLAKARNSPVITSSNQWAAGTMVGGLNQESSGTNTVALFQTLSQIFGQLATAAAKGAVP